MKITSSTKIGKRQRHILNGIIYDDKTLGAISSKIHEHDKMFVNSWANLVLRWCLDYYKTYAKAPGYQNLKVSFDSWSEDNKEHEYINDIGQFLDGIYQEEYKTEINSDHLIDLSTKQLNRMRLLKLSEGIQADLDKGKENSALERIASFSKVEMGSRGWMDTLSDMELVDWTFNRQKDNVLITYPGDLGKFFGACLKRKAFVSFLAPEKTGKSFWLLDIVWRAVHNRLRVAYFDVGDNAGEEINERFYVRAAVHPYESDTGEWPYTIKYPISITPPKEEGDFYATVEHEDRTFDAPLDAKTVKRALRRVMKFGVKSLDSYLKVSCHPNFSINVPGIKTELELLEMSGWVPDVVIIDYADILAPPPGRMESRDQINTAWKQMRGLSQERNCLLITATQSDAASYEKRIISRMNFSEDKRKLSHVTLMVAINMTGEEKDSGLVRLNHVVRRKGGYSSRKVVHVAGCLAVSNPTILSTF